MEKEALEDLITISKFKNANIEKLFETAYLRGFNTGIEVAKSKAIEAIINEK